MHPRACLTMRAASTPVGSAPGTAKGRTVTALPCPNPSRGPREGALAGARRYSAACNPSAAAPSPAGTIATKARPRLVRNSTLPSVRAKSV